MEEHTDEKQANTKESNLVQVFLNINSSLKDALKDLSDDIGTSRISIYVFHNGVYSSHGLPFFKISCICEIVEKNCGVVKILNHIQGYHCKCLITVFHIFIRMVK